MHQKYWRIRPQLAPIQKGKNFMADTRNTALLKEVVEVFQGFVPPSRKALEKLEARFGDDYLLIAGSIESIAAHAKELRLDITTEECGAVLDYIARERMVSVTIEQVETAAYALFGNRFIEP